MGLLSERNRRVRTREVRSEVHFGVIQLLALIVEGDRKLRNTGSLWMLEELWQPLDARRQGIDAP